MENQTKSLVDAVLFGLAEVERFLAVGGDVNEPGYEGRTALIAAADRGEAGIVARLVGAGASLSLADRCGRTALSYAAQRGATEVVRLLLAAGANPNTTDEGTRSAVHYCAQAGNLACMQALAAGGADLSAEDHSGRNALHWALDSRAQNASQELLRFLVKAEVPINLPDAYDRTPLHLAASWDGADAVRLLLDAGADPTPADHSGATALRCAAFSGQLASMELLLATSDTPEPAVLIAAVQRYQDAEAAVRSLLRAGADPCGVDRLPALSAAAIRDRVDIAQILLAAGAEVEGRDDRGVTALMDAASNNALESVRLLVRWGADLTASSDEGSTALHLAVAAPGDDPAVASFLVESGADTDATDDDGATPAELATRLGKPKILAALAPAGAATVKQRAARLFAACRAGDVAEATASLNGAPLREDDLVRAFIAGRRQAPLATCLLRGGLDPNAMFGEPPRPVLLHSITFEKIVPGAVEAFLAAGFDVDLVGEFGATLLHWLAGKGDPGYDRPINYDDDSRARLCDLAGAVLDVCSDPDALDAEGSTALHYALRRRPGLVGALLDAGADVNLADRRGYTPLMCAVGSTSSPSGESDERVADLISRGADPTAVRQSDGRTALLDAISQGDRGLEKVKILLAAGAPTDVVGRFGATPISLAAELGLEELLGELREVASPAALATAVVAAAGAGRVEILKDLLASGCSPDAHEPKGRRALSAAARGGQAAAMELLLASGADPNLIDPGSEQTPLMAAARRSHTAQARRLLEAGAAADRVSGGTSALHEACFALSDEIISLLLTESVDPNRRVSGYVVDATPLHAASASVSGTWDRVRVRRCFEALIAAGADVDARDEHGQTALHLLAMGATRSAALSSVDAVQLLLDAGADVGIELPDHRTSADIARERGSERLARLLVSGI